MRLAVVLFIVVAIAVAMYRDVIGEAGRHVLRRVMSRSVLPLLVALLAVAGAVAFALNSTVRLI